MADLLSGVNVVDCSSLIPGPLCSMMLRDLGANVVRIESPKGDRLRFFGGKETSPYFAVLNRGKRSVVLDLKEKKDRIAFWKIAKKADILIAGTRAKAAAQLGLDYLSIKRLNRKIIYCSITGYGLKGKQSGKAGHDLNYLARSGMLSLLSKGQASVPRVQLADLSAGTLACSAILAALFSRERTGKGVCLDLSMADAASYLFGMYLSHDALKGEEPYLTGGFPCYNIYETKDKRYVSLGAIESKFWQSFCNAVKRKDLLKRQFDDSIFEAMRTLFKGKSMDEWLKLNEKYDFCCEPVKKIENVINEADLNKRRAIITIDGVTQAALPFAFSAFGRLKYSRPPKLGEHTKEILLEIGYGKKDVNGLRKRKVIF